MINNEDIIIIGAGPAGVNCSIQLKRYGFEPLVIEQNKIGGLAANANLIENYCAFPNGIKGDNFVKVLAKQFNNNNIRLHSEKVINVSKENNKYSVKTTKGDFLCNHLVIATGTTPNILNFTSEKIFYEVDKLKEKNDLYNKNIVIIGAGDAAFDYALNLADKNKITILNKSNRTKCLDLLKNRVLHHKNISYLEFTRVNNIQEIDDKLKLSGKDQKKDLELNCDYLLGAIGRIANTEFLSENLINSENHDNFYIIGDAKNGIFRQIAIACGDGLITAMKIYNKKVGEYNESSCLCR
ncbi:MAG: NAD(P)/FAD-dependent oxidoreductase [bacterium]